MAQKLVLLSTHGDAPPPSFPCSTAPSLCLLGADPRVRVGDLDSEHARLLHNRDALAAANAVGDLSGKGAVVHEEELDLALVVDEEALEAVGHDVARLLVGTVSDVGHGELALEPAANAVVDSLGLAPGRVLETGIAIRLVAPG